MNNVRFEQALYAITREVISTTQVTFLRRTFFRNKRRGLQKLLSIAQPLLPTFDELGDAIINRHTY